MRREDLAGFATWGRHTEPRFRLYDVGALSEPEVDALWRILSGSPGSRPYAGLVDGRFAAQLMLRAIDETTRSGEIGIALDPRLIGHGLGRRILWAFLRYLVLEERFEYFGLEVAADNERAIAAYRSAGFAACGERWGSDGVVDGPIIRMEMIARPETFS